MRLSPLALCVVGAFGLLTAGCGGTAYSSVFGAPEPDGGYGGEDAGPLPDAGPNGHDSGPGVDSSAPWSPECPAALPAIGTACARDTLQCEYGSATWNVACDVVVQCQAGSWASYTPSYGPCTPEPGPNSASCPAGFDDVPQGAACGSPGLSCSYAQGVCDCTEGFGGVEVPVNTDGGVSGYWSCEPEPGCPYPRPRVGSACSNEGTYCTYEACGYEQTCTGGVWQGQAEACAYPGGFVKR
jgi:hypothetical protein